MRALILPRDGNHLRCPRQHQPRDSHFVPSFGGLARLVALFWASAATFTPSAAAGGSPATPIDVD
jgi:hypothetical protein